METIDDTSKEQIFELKRKMNEAILSHEQYLIEHKDVTDKLIDRIVVTNIPILEKLHFHTKYKDLFELKRWIGELSDKMITKNHLIAAGHTGINEDCENMFLKKC